MKTVVDALKDLNGLIGAIAAILESHFSLFSINPAITHQMLYPSIAAAVLSGFGAHRQARQTHQYRVGWIGLALFLVCASLVIALSNGMDTHFDPRTANVITRLSYMFCFAGIGAAVGGFLE